MNRCPKLTDFSQRFAIKHANVTYHITKTEDQTTGDDRRQQWHKNFSQMGNTTL
ncbi:Uncharacterised protein [Vibrio cholerae]|nr:Uncharacterised protein [Vibrio cholerae]